MANILCSQFLEELETEVTSTRKCLERIPRELFTWKVHDKSLNMGYTANIVAEIPRWISLTIDKSIIDFAAFERFVPKTTDELVKYFMDNLELARTSLKNFTDEGLSEMFYLKNNGQVLASSTKKESISSSINHLVHHRGQLTVYMRLNEIPVPSIYGPSADDKTF